MGVYTHWGGAENGGAGGDRGVYNPSPEHGRTLHCNSSYHGLVSGGGAEAGTAPIQAMLGASYSRYPGDKGGASRKRGGGRRQVQKNQRDRERDIRVWNDEGRELIQIGVLEMIGRRYDGWDIM